MDALDDATMEDVWGTEGDRAAGEGKLRHFCPYPMNTLAGLAWHSGWMIRTINDAKRGATVGA